MNINNGKTGIIDIPGALHSTGGDGDNQIGGVVAYTGDIYDANLNRNQADINENMLVLDEHHNLLINKDYINVEGHDNLLRGGAMLGYALSGSNSQYELKLYDENWYQNNLGYQFVKFLKGSKILDNELTPVATITNATYNSSNKKITIITDTDLGELNGEYFNMLNQNIANSSFCSGMFLNKGGYSTLIGNDNYNTGYGNILLGDNNTNNGEQTVLIGRVNAVKSDTDQCYILGEGNKVNGISNLYSVGCINTSTGDNLYSFALGADAKFTRGSTTGNDWITQVGIGEHLNISQNEFVLGQYNKDYDIADSSKRNFFVIGNGTESTRSNSLEQKANGDLYVKGIGNFDGTNSNVDTTKSLQSKINDLQTQIDNVNISNFYTKSEIDAQNAVTSTALNDLSDRIDNAGGVTSYNDLTDKPTILTQNDVETIVDNQSATISSSLNDLDGRITTIENDNKIAKLNNQNSVSMGTELVTDGKESIAGGAGVYIKGNRSFGYGSGLTVAYLTGNNGTYDLMIKSSTSYSTTNKNRNVFADIFTNTYLRDANTLERVAKILTVTANSDGQPITITTDTDLGEITSKSFGLENVTGDKSFTSGVFANTGIWSNLMGFMNYSNKDYVNALGTQITNSGTYANLFGTGITNTDTISNVIGYDVTNKGKWSSLIGYSNVNTNQSNTIIGNVNTVNGINSSIIGQSNTVNENCRASIIGEQNVATKSSILPSNKKVYSWMLGTQLTTSFDGIALGYFNKDYPEETTTANQNFLAIGMGNGGKNDRANGLEIKANGDLYIDRIGGYNGKNSTSSSVLPLQTIISNLQSTITSLQSRVTALENQLNGGNA